MRRLEKLLVFGIAVLTVARISTAPVDDLAATGDLGARTSDRQEKAVIGCVPGTPCPALHAASYEWKPDGFRRPGMPLAGGTGLNAMPKDWIGHPGLTDTQRAFLFADTLVRQYRHDLKPALHNCGRVLTINIRKWEKHNIWLVKGAERVLAKLGALEPPAKAPVLSFTQQTTMCARVAQGLAAGSYALPAEGRARIAHAALRAKPGMLTPNLRRNHAAVGRTLY